MKQVEKRQLLIRLEPELHHRLRVLTVQKRITINKLVEDYLKGWVRENDAIPPDSTSRA